MPTVGTIGDFLNLVELTHHDIFIFLQNKKQTKKYQLFRRQHYLPTFNGYNLSLFFQKSTPTPQRY